MNRRSTDYKINQTTFRVCYGDITKLEIGAVVSSDDNYLTMGGGVSMAIARAGGMSVREDARKFVPLKIGEVAVTTAGTLPAKYVFHAVTIDYDKLVYPNADYVEQATRTCLELADTLHVRSIAFPALGTGVGGFPFQIAADCMTRAIAEYLMESTNLELVILTLFAREGVKESDLNIFYERAVALATVSTQSKKLGLMLAELDKIVTKANRADLRHLVNNLRGELVKAESVLSEHPRDFEHFEQIEKASGISGISLRAIEVTTQTAETVKWDDQQLEAEVLRTKLSGLWTRLNIQTAQLNKLQIEKAKYGGIGVPPRLEHAIQDLKDEIDSIETRTEAVRGRLISLNFAA